MREEPATYDKLNCTQQRTTISLSNSEVAILRKSLDMFDDATLGFSSTVRDILSKLERGQK